MCQSSGDHYNTDDILQAVTEQKDGNDTHLDMKDIISSQLAIQVMSD